MNDQSDMFVSAEVAAAIAERKAVVALETTLVTHGLPAPDGVRVALALEDAVRQRGAVPATIGIDGWQDLCRNEPQRNWSRLAATQGVVKLNLQQLCGGIGSGASGSTTVAATMFVADRVGIRGVRDRRDRRGASRFGRKRRYVGRLDRAFSISRGGGMRRGESDS